MTENSARFGMMIFAGMGLLCIFLCLFIGLGGGSSLALYFLIFAIICVVITIIFARLYTSLRKVRWDQELNASQNQLNQLFDEAKKQRPAGSELDEKDL